MVAGTANADGLLSLVPSFGLHTLHLSYGRCLIFTTVVPTVGQGMAINQTKPTLLHGVCAIRLVGL